jgi:hypothetical protein
MLKKIALSQIYITLLFSFLIQVFGFPEWVKYLSDGINIVLVWGIIKQRSRVNIKELKYPLIGMFLLLLIGVKGYLSGNYSIIQFLWEVRTLYRFPLFMIICIHLFNINDIKTLKNIFYKIFYLNFFLSVIQYYIFGISGDYLGGIFGIKSTNAATCLFLCITLSYFFSDYFNRKLTSFRLLINVVMALWIVLYAELKVMIFLIPVIVGIQLMLSTKLFKTKLLLLTLSIVALFVTITIYSTIYGMDFFTKDSVEEYITEDYGEAELSRMSAVPIVSKIFLTSNDEQLFGLGMGIATNSSFSTNGFYQRHEYLHYDWFSNPYMLLENGWIGLGLYYLFFISLLVYAWKKHTQLKDKYPDYPVAITVTMPIIAIVMLFYNCSMRLECAYLIYVIFCIPYIYMKPAKLQKK